MWWGVVCIVLKTSEAFFVVCLDTDVENKDDKMAQTIHNSIGTTLHCVPSTDADIIASVQRMQAQECFSIKFTVIHVHFALQLGIVSSTILDWIEWFAILLSVTDKATTADFQTHAVGRKP